MKQENTNILKKDAKVPVINMLTDLQTSIDDHRGDFTRKTEEMKQSH